MLKEISIISYLAVSAASVIGLYFNIHRVLVSTLAENLKTQVLSIFVYQEN